MEAPKLEQLLKVAELRNPNWYPFIHGYLKGELDSLELDDDYFMDEYTTLNLGNYDTCVVGESLGFKKKYSHNGFENCFICGRFADKLFYNGGTTDTDTDADGNDVPEIEDQRMIFAENLRDFYIHMGYMK